MSYPFVKETSSLLFLLILSSVLAYGQVPEPKVIPPSPNAAAFAKYGNIPVSQYTGVPNISVPIYEIKVRDVSVPISLSYHASGIKVSEEASRVGLGWVLNTGGVISRNVVNKDDFLEDVTAYLHPNNTSPILPNGPRYVPPSNNIQGGTTLVLMDSENAPSTVSYDLMDHIYGSDVDYEPDHFSYNFMGYAGKFILGRDRVPILEKQEKIKITPNQDGSSWEVWTADGFKYTFAASEYFVDLLTAGYQQKSAWYLTEILSPQGEKVTFHYEGLTDQFIKPVGYFNETVQANQFSCETFSCTAVPNHRGTIPRKKYSNIYLSFIRWQHGKVAFEMAAREDLEGDVRVQSIKVYENGKLLPQEEYVLVESYKLETSYFDYTVGSATFPMPDVSSERLRKRLKLNSIAKYSAEQNSSKEFEYWFNYYETQNTDQLPPKNSFARDHWGYHNGKGNASLIPSYQRVLNPISFAEIGGIMGQERNPSAEHMRGFSLKEIIYPTGGKTTFHYGANDYEIDTLASSEAPEIYEDWKNMLYDAVANKGVLKSTVLDVRDEYVSNTGSVIPIEVSGFFRTNDPCHQLVGVPIIYFEIVSEDGQTSYSNVSLGLPRSSQPDAIDSIYCDASQVSMGGFSYKGYVTLQPGKYLWRAFVDGNETRFQDISVAYSYWVDSRKRSPLGLNKKYNLAGGLRIERLEDYDPLTNKVFNVRKFDYHYMADHDGDSVSEEHSYGKRMVRPNYSYFDVTWEKKVLDSLGNAAFCTDCVSLMRQSDSFLPATGSQGNVVGYDKVIESFGVNRENGHSEYDFENEPDVILPAYYPHGDSQYPLKPAIISTRSNSLNGRLKQKTDFNSLGIRVHQITNTYLTKFNKSGFGLEYKRLRVIGFSNGDYVVTYGLYGTRSEVLMNLYTAQNSIFSYLASATETSYDIDGELQTSIATTNSYDNQNHLQLTETSKERSNGHRTITQIKYPADYTDQEGGTAISLMKGGKHQHSIPIEISIVDEDVNGMRKVLSRNLNSYDVFNGRVLPKESAALLNSRPLLPSEIDPYTPSAGYNPAQFRSLYTLDYTDGGNVRRVQKPFSNPVSFIWSVSNTFPIAEVNNATPTECYYENFEEGTSTSFVEGPLLAHTGKRYLNGDFVVDFIIPNGRSYVIEYWFYENGKWNYNSKAYTGNTMLTDGSAIDNVRIYPADAQMKSYTYDRLRGMTSIIDMNNLTYRYEYDTFGRLQIIRNDKGEIEKLYTYNYAE